jgi:hypothetical protein
MLSRINELEMRLEKMTAKYGAENQHVKNFAEKIQLYKEGKTKIIDVTEKTIGAVGEMIADWTKRTQIIKKGGKNV